MRVFFVLKILLLQIYLCKCESFVQHNELFRKDILLTDLYSNNRLEGCPITTRNAGDTVQLVAECDEGASFAQLINDNGADKSSESENVARRTIPSSVGVNLKKLTKGVLDEDNLNFKQINYDKKLFQFKGSALNTIHFADGNVAVSDVKIKNLEFVKGEKEFSKVKLEMTGTIEINGDQLMIQLDKTFGKSTFDVTIKNAGSVTVEELATAFKASVDHINILKSGKKFKTDDIKTISLSNPTIIGKLTTDGVMQVVANAEANDDNLSFGKENLFVVINKKRGENPKIALVFNIGKGKSMDQIFSSLSERGFYKFSFPMIGKISTFDWALSLSEGNDITLAAPEPMLLPIGLSARTELSRDDFKKICKDTSSDIPEAISIELQVKSDGRYLYKMTNGLNPNMEKFLECISADKKSEIKLPSEVFTSSAKVNISHFHYDPKTSEYDLRLSVENSIWLFNAALEVKNVDVRIIKDQKEWTVTSVGMVSKEKGQEYDISVEIFQSDKIEKTVKATVQNLNLQELLMVLGFDKDEFHLSNSFPDLSNFGFSDLVLTEEKNGYRISGSPFLFGANLQLAGVAWKGSNTLAEKLLTDDKKPHRSNFTVNIHSGQQSHETSANEQEDKNDIFSLDSNADKNEQSNMKSSAENTTENIKLPDLHAASSKKVEKTKQASHFFFRPYFLNTSSSKKNGHLFFGSIDSPDEDYILETSSGSSSIEDHHNITTESSNETKSSNTSQIENVHVGSITKGFDKHGVPGLDLDVDQKDPYFDEVSHYSEYTNPLGNAHSIEDTLNSDSSPLNVNAELSNIFSNLKRSHARHLQNNVVHEKRSHGLQQKKHRTKYSSRGRRALPDKPFVNSITKYSIVLGITAINERLDHLLENMYGKRITSAAWFDNMMIVIIFSNTDKDIPMHQKFSDKASVFKRSAIITSLLNTTGEIIQKRHYVARRNLENSTKQSEMLDFVPDEWEDEFTTTKLPFSAEDLGSIKIRKGLSLSCAMGMPDNCKRNELCRWLKKRLAEDVKITLTGYLSQTKINLISKLHMSELLTTDGNVKIDSSELLFNYNENDQQKALVRVRLGMVIKIPQAVTVKGYLYEASSGKLQIVSSLKTSDDLDLSKAYGFSKLQFTEPLFHSIVDLEKDTMTSVAMSASIVLGKVDPTQKEDSIKLQAIYHFDARTPQNNYLISDVNDITLQAVANALGYKEKLPKAVSQTTFSSGAKLLFTSNQEGVDVKSLGYHIDYGYSIIGEVRIFEFYQPIKCLLSDKKISCSIQMLPLDILNGLTQVRYSRNLPNKGPVLDIIMSSQDSSVTLRGYLHTLGAASSVSMDFIDDHVLFNITGRFYDIFHMDISFKGKMSGQILKTEYQFEGCLKESDRTIITHAVVKLINDAIVEAGENIGKCNALVKNTQRGYKTAERRLDGWKFSIEGYLDKLKKRLEQMKEAKVELKKSCDAECGDVCVPFFGWNTQCYKIWGNWVGCPGWDNCKWKVKDILCIARCELEKMGKKIILWGDTVGIDAIFGSTQMLTSLRTTCTEFVKSYQTLVDASKQLLKTVTSTFKPVLDVKKVVGKVYTNNSIILRSICTSGYLNKYWKTSSFFSVQGMLYNTSIQWKTDVSIDASIHRKIAEKTINKRFPEMYPDGLLPNDFFGGISNLQRRQMELDEQEGTIQSKIDDIVSGRSYFRKGMEGKGTRTTVSSKEEAYYRSIVDDPIIYDHMNADSMHAFHRASPWNLLEGFNFDMNNVPLFTGTQEESEVTEVRSLDSCQQMKRVVDKYDKLTQGMKRFADSSEYQRQMYLQTKKSYLKDLEEMKKDINNLELSRNLSVADLEDLFFWYNKIRHGLQEWNAKSEAIYIEGQKKGLLAFKNQMDYILKKQKEASIEEYVATLHTNGIDAYKRSHLPNFPAIKGGLYLSEIKKAILDLYNDVDSTPEEFNEKISKTENRIEQLKSFMVSCQQDAKQ